jgi:hypothetical protein
MVVGVFCVLLKFLHMGRCSEHRDGVEEKGPGTYVRSSISDEGGK